MKRSHTGVLLVILVGVILAGLLLINVINGNRDPIAVLEEFGAKHEKQYAVRTIERNEKGEVVVVNLDGASISPLSRQLLFEFVSRGFGRPDRLLSDADLVHLKGLTKLESLSLYDTAITDAGLVHLKGLTNLQALSLWNTRITDAGLVHLKGLTNLQTLDLRGTAFTGTGLVHLKEMTNLQTLDLSYTTTTKENRPGLEFTDAGLVHLKGMTQLQKLDLSGWWITDAGVADLQKALPNCKIRK